jgi:hypothetical protein
VDHSPEAKRDHHAQVSNKLIVASTSRGMLLNTKHYRDAGTLGGEVLDGLDGGADTGVVGDGLAVKGNVEVAADENLFLSGNLVSHLLHANADDAVLFTRKNMSTRVFRSYALQE